MKLLRFLILICTMLSLGAMAQPTQLPEKFISGDLRYDCVWGCNFKFDYSRNSINEIYRNKDWIGLVNKMDEFGLNSRTTYFALFRAAEELGHYEAARVYLKLAKANGLEMGCFAINKLDMCAEMSRINSITVKEKTLSNKPIGEDSLKVLKISSSIMAQPTQLPEKFRTGELRYDCTFSCTGKAVANWEKLKQAYLEKKWDELILGVDEIGVNSRYTYLLLARSAQELGYVASAEKYFEVAMAGGVVPSGCSPAAQTAFCDQLILDLGLGSQCNTFMSCMKLKSTEAKLTINNKPISEGSFKVSEISSAPVQQATAPNQENERLLADVAEEKRKQAETEEKLRVAQQLASQNRENERLRAEASDAKRKQTESEDKVSITQQQIPQRNDLRSRNLAINWRLETFGGNLGNSYCQASNITYNGRNTNDGSAIFWVVVDCRTSRSGSSGGQYRFCGINHQEIMRQTGFTSVCRAD